VKPRRAWRAAATILLIAGLATSGAAVSQTDMAGETFDAVWKIVRDTHFDPAFDLEQWDRVSKELRPKALDAKTPGELRAVLADMLGRLGLSHFAVIPSTPDNPTDHSNLSGQPGFDIRLIDKQLVVTSVDPSGGAAAAGVHQGWIVEKIGGSNTAALLAGIPASTSPRILQLEAWRRAIPLLRGPSGMPARSRSSTAPARWCRRASSARASLASPSPSATCRRCSCVSRRKESRRPAAPRPA